MYKEDKLKIKLGVIIMENVQNDTNENAFKEIGKLAEKYREKYASINIGSIPEVAAGRKLFKSIGIDPTKHRPSSEALLRRALKNKSFYKFKAISGMTTCGIHHHGCFYLTL